MISILYVISWEGHHPSYCAEQIRACNSFSSKIFVICPAGANPLKQVGGPDALLKKISVVSHANSAAKTGFKKFADLEADFKLLRLLVTSIQESNPGDELFFFHTSLDSLFVDTLHLPLLRLSIRKFLPWRFSGMLMSPDRRWPMSKARKSLDRQLGPIEERRFFKRFVSSMFDWLFAKAATGMRSYFLWQRNQILKSSSCEQIAILDERYADYLSRKTGKQIVIYPETTSGQVSKEPSNLIQKIITKRSGNVVVSVLGHLERRKCVDVLLDVIQYHNTEGILFVLAGLCDFEAFSPSHRAFLESEIHRKSNVIFSPEVISSEGDFNGIIQNCDIMYCVYRDHAHSSNIISKAAYYRKAVLVNRGELMAKRVEDYGLGRVLSECTADACINTIRGMIPSGNPSQILKAAKYKEYLKFHSFEELQSVMTRLSRTVI